MEATIKELLDLADALSTEDGENRLITLSSDSDLQHMEIDTADGMVLVQVAGAQILVRGEKVYLEKFARDVECLTVGESPPEGSRLRLHHHYEHYPGHFFLDGNSVPLVLTRID